MDYGQLRSYFKKLQEQPFDIQIDWDVIKTPRIRAFASEKRMGLQLADAVASGFFFGVNKTKYGFSEEKYATMLKNVVYNHRGRYAGYGIKLFPVETEKLITEKSHLQWLQDIFGL